MIIHLSSADFKVMPWANGKGSTVEVLRLVRDGRLGLRLSRAMVVEEGDFSIFPGIDRNLTVLSGPGFDLTGEGIALSARKLVPVAFPGDVPVKAEGVSAPSEDFNVMWDRGFPAPQVWVQGAGDIPAGSGVLALETGLIAAREVARYDLILADQALVSDCSVMVVRSAILDSLGQQ